MKFTGADADSQPEAVSGSSNLATLPAATSAALQRAAPSTGTSHVSTGDWQLFGKTSSAHTADPISTATVTPEESARVNDLLMEARERFRVSVDASRGQRAEAMIDQQFAAGIQWDADIQRRRDAQGRPCLTNNRIPGFVDHVTNNMRQSRPEIKVDPVGDGADEEIAEIRQGLMRHIAVQSRADIAYDKAFVNMCISGLGYVRVVDGWADGKVRDKDLFIQWVPNTFTVYEDPAASRPDWSDGRYKFVVEDLSLPEFKRRFRGKSAVSINEFQSIGDHQPYWLPGGKIRIAEYWHIEDREDRLCELADGTTILESKMQGFEEVVDSRPETVPQVIWTLMTGVEILDEREWDGKYIPIIPFVGNQIDLDGDRILVGMVRYAREAQRMFNFMYSSFVETIALAPKNSYIAEIDQISEFIDDYKRANTDPMAVLVYKAKDAGNGSPLPPPHREQSNPPIAAFIEGLKLADQNLKSVFRIFDASLGERGPQESGLAINSRKIESDLSTYNWIDNFGQGLQFLGIVLDDLLPYYYNNPGRIISILREDMSRKPTVMNQLHQVEGQDKIYDLSKGKCAITISTGPSYPTRRRESADSMLKMVQAYPPLMQIAGPQIVRAQDWAGKDIIADQMEKAMPPELRTPDDSQPPQIPPEAQQMITNLQQLAQQLTEHLKAATDETAKERMKQEFETYRTQMTQETNLAIASMKNASAEAGVLVKEIFEEYKRVQMAAEPEVLGGSKPESAPAPAAPQVSPEVGVPPAG